MDLQSLCELGQRQLVQTDYLGAEAALVEAEAIAWESRDWDTLSRLYMPLQETRRQRRQRCGEGIVKLDLLGVDTRLDAEQIVAAYPHGQLLVAGYASLDLAKDVRRLARERSLYLETFLAASYILNGVAFVAIVPTDRVEVPAGERDLMLDGLLAKLPPFSIVRPAEELRHGERQGNDTTYAQTMQMWESLHAPFLAAALATTDPVRKMAALREVIEVDYACEIAHQHLSSTARHLLQRH